MTRMHARNMNGHTGGRLRPRRIWSPGAGRGGRPVRPRVFNGPAAGLAVIVAAAALALTACGGGSTPRVASLGADPGSGHGGGSGGAGTSDGSTPAARSVGGVTTSLTEWGACERSHGDPHQADPTVDASGVINVTIPQGAQAFAVIGNGTGTCSHYLAKAENMLRAANPVPPPPNQAAFLKYVNCMRANGVPGYPYPTGNAVDFQGTGVDPYSPSVNRVNQLCGRKLGLPAWWINGTYTPGSLDIHSGGSNFNPIPPPCFYTKGNPCSGRPTVSGGNGGPAAAYGSGGHG
jgi:hypothetical protein